MTYTNEVLPLCLHSPPPPPPSKTYQHLLGHIFFKLDSLMNTDPAPRIHKKRTSISLEHTFALFGSIGEHRPRPTDPLMTAHTHTHILPLSPPLDMLEDSWPSYMDISLSWSLPSAWLPKICDFFQNPLFHFAQNEGAVTSVNAR